MRWPTWTSMGLPCPGDRLSRRNLQLSVARRVRDTRRPQINQGTATAGFGAQSPSAGVPIYGELCPLRVPVPAQASFGAPTRFWLTSLRSRPTCAPESTSPVTRGSTHTQLCGSPLREFLPSCTVQNKINQPWVRSLRAESPLSLQGKSFLGEGGHFQICV